MGIPQVVIVGRPNVGKSSLFNWLAGKRLAITDGEAGVTRDRLSFLMHVEGKYFEIVDTGGMGFIDPDNLTAQVEDQITQAIESATVVLFVVDTLTGLTAHDREVIKRLRGVNVPVICVANKTDAPHLDAQAGEFFSLGLPILVRVSVLHNRGRDELMRALLRYVPVPDQAIELAATMPEMKLAIVGRQNVGKSTFINMLAQAERVIVSEVAGTTRDSIDVRFDLDGKPFTAIDTPGLRRTKSIHTNVDYYSLHRAQRSIRRADVVFMFFDPQERVSRVDKQLCDYVCEQYKPCIFVVNKWDLFTKNVPTGKWVTYLREQFPTMWHAPIAFITAKTGKNVKALLNHGQMLFKQSLDRIPTPDLNKLVRAAMVRTPPPLYKSHRPKIYFATQVGTQPPTIVLFCNNPAAFAPTYRRYLLGVFRDQLSFGEVPIKLYLRKRKAADEAFVPDEVDFEEVGVEEEQPQEG